MIELLARSPAVRSALRRVSDWTDLAWSTLDADLKSVATRAHGRLLDVGCGSKPYEHIFRPYVTEYLGIEHEATFAKTAAVGHAGKPDLYYDGGRLPFEDGTFDTVLNVQVAEHTPRPGFLIGELGRVLAKDGTLIVSVPFQFRLHEQPHDYFRFTPHGLQVLCADAGLEIDEVRPHGGLWSVLAHKLNTYLALRVGRLGGFAQALGKLSHEGTSGERPRLWALPAVAGAMLTCAGVARVLDRVLPEPDESIGFLIIARRRIT